MCDSTDTDDDNDGVPDECDYSDNQDPIHGTYDYVHYMWQRGGQCTP